MTEIKLNALTRSGKNNKAKQIRTDGFVPAVIYGSGAVSRSLKIKSHDFERVFNLAGGTNLIDLIINNEQAVKAVIKDMQRGGVKDDIIHVDFYQVDMNKKISAEIPFNFIGAAKAVQKLGGTMIKNIDSVEIECLPGDLIHHIDVDLSKLAGFNDVIRIADLTLSPDIIIINKQDEIIVSVIEPRKIEEEVKEKVEEGVVAGEDESGEPSDSAGQPSNASPSAGKQDIKGKKGENKKEGEKK